MSSKPIQDRIYRSRLTIKYRTNIDGVPVPQTLPLRLLVMGDLTGRTATAKDPEAPPLPEALRFENREIVSIKKGERIDNILEGMDITLPIPEFPEAPELARTARVDGRFSSGWVEGGPWALAGEVDDINDEGSCRITGTVGYKAELYDNRAITLEGSLAAEGSLQFEPATVDVKQLVTLTGNYGIHVQGTSSLSVYGLEPDPEEDDGTYSVQVIGQGSVWHGGQDQASDPAWITGEVRGKLKGTLKPEKDRQRAQLEVREQQLEIAFGKGIKYSLGVGASIPLVNQAELIVDGGKASFSPQDGARASFEVGDTDATPIAVSVFAGPSRDGKPTVMIKPSGKVTLKAGNKEFTGIPSGMLVAADDQDGSGKAFTGQLTVTDERHDEHEVDVTITLDVSGKKPTIPAGTTVTPAGKVRHVVTVDRSFDVDIDSVSSNAGALNAVVNAAIMLPRAGGGMLMGVASGTLTGVAGSFAVGQQAVTGELEIEAGDEKLKLPVKATVNITVADEVWAVDDTSPAACELGGTVPVAVSGSIEVRHLLKIASNVIKLEKHGIYKADFRDSTIITLESQPGEPSYKVMGLLEGALKCDLKRKIESGAKDFATPTAVLNATFTDPQTKGSCKLEGGLEIKIPRPRVKITLYGKLKGKADDVMVGPDALLPEDVRADVYATLKDSDKKAALNSHVTIDAEGHLSVGIEGLCEAKRSIRIKSLDAFAPDSVAQNVPELRRLRILRGLLGELKTDINLMPPVRDQILKLLRSVSEYKPPTSSQKENLYPVLRRKLCERYPALEVKVPKALQGEAAEEETITPKELDDGALFFDRIFPDYETALARAAEVPGGPDPHPEHALVMVPTREENGQALPGLIFHEHDILDRVSDRGRLLNGLAALVINDASLYQETDLIGRIDRVMKSIDDLVQTYVMALFQSAEFRLLERNWRGIAELCEQVESDQVIIDLLDVASAELQKDLEDHRGDIFTSTLFKRIYIEEYDRYGGKPFGAMIGLYRFDSSDEDIDMLTTLSEIANAAHCPFISSINPKFFGQDIESWKDLESIGDIEAHLNLPKFGKWNVLRDSAEAPYIGLTLPGYLLRKPWGAEEDQLGNRNVRYDETKESWRDFYLWGNSAILFAKNLVRSFEGSGWCQYIRGVKGGGLIQGMTVHTVKRHGKEETQSPVQCEIADYRELQFAKAGLIPLVHCKGSSDAAFFSSQSIKKPRDFRSEIDTQNAYLVCNLAYTFSITRIAHYVKRMMRDYIGSTADGAYIQNILQLWLNDYITTTVNPDDLTLRYYPFKAVAVTVEPKPGPLGWYKAVISILPHIQFEGMDVELRLEAALGGK